MAQLLDRYALEVVPGKAPKTQESNRISIRPLRLVFGSMPIVAIKPRRAYQYRDKVTKKHGATSANRDLEVLSHSLSKAVEWGLIDRNPVKGQVRKNRIPRRERYVEDWEINEACKVSSPMLRAYIVSKLLTGLRRGDLLRLKVTDLGNDGIHVRTSKTGKYLLITWSKELAEAVECALAARTIDIVPWLFCTRSGTCYVQPNGSANAFDSLWQRFMTRAIEKTMPTERFQEKDLRKKTATDMGLHSAQKLLGHSRIETTTRHYRLKAERVSPHSLRSNNVPK
jgi:integrase